MAHSWKEQLQAYLQALNKTYVDGYCERLFHYFADPEVLRHEQERWQRERELAQQREIFPLSSKLQATPLRVSGMERERVEVLLSLRHEWSYQQNKTALCQKNQRIHRVTMRREGDSWFFELPWGYFFPSPAQPQENLEQEGHHGEEEQDDWEQQPSAQFTETEEFFDSPTGDVNSPLQAIVYAGQYNRSQAVAYANRYWNEPNPSYPYFDVDCTNYVSQCLHAGGVPMVRTNNRSTGWWFQPGAKPNWSFSWAVANSLYLLLRSGKAPFHARQVDHPSELEPGDVICYDFDGDGHWQHNTIVVAKDEQGMPLVNAHTTNSSHRYWAYTDSSAYTDRIQYGFFQILSENRS